MIKEGSWIRSIQHCSEWLHTSSGLSQGVSMSRVWLMCGGSDALRSIKIDGETVFWGMVGPVACIRR